MKRARLSTLKRTIGICGLLLLALVGIVIVA